jgi:hypothetical protein
MLILESLKGISGYPVPMRTFENISLRRGLILSDEATKEALETAAYRLAKADVLRWVSFAPNVSQDGVSFDMLYSDRNELRQQANAIYLELGDAEYIPEVKSNYGYQGSSL